MRVLILGGTGLISTGITSQLLERGDEVVHFNRGETPSQFGQRVGLVVGDRNSTQDLSRAVESGPFDAVIDMICFTPDQAKSAINAFKGQATQYLMCSTVDVYDKPSLFSPVTEDHPRNPAKSFPYAYLKAQAEALFEAAHSNGDFLLTILRPGATYVNGAVPSIGSFALAVNRLRRGLPIIVHGDGSSIWVACHRDDVAQAFVNTLNNPRAFGKSYNVTGGEYLTWNEYWETVAEELKVPNVKFLHVPTDVLVKVAPNLAEWCGMNFQYNNILSSEAAQRDLGFQYRTKWREGVKTFGWGTLPDPDPIQASDYNAIVVAWEKACSLLVEDLARTEGL